MMRPSACLLALLSVIGSSTALTSGPPAHACRCIAAYRNDRQRKGARPSRARSWQSSYPMIAPHRIEAMFVSPSSGSEPHAPAVSDCSSFPAKSVILPKNEPKATTALWKKACTQVPVHWKLEWAFPASAMHSPPSHEANAVNRQELVERALQALRSHPDVATSALTSDHHLELANIMSSFADWVQKNIPPGSAKIPPDRLFRRATMKFDANRGREATKCPQWHYDNVPFRWIQSLVGPGVDVVVDERAVNWPFLNSRRRGDHDDGKMKRVLSVSERNRQVLPATPERAPTATMPEGVPVILLGGRWNEWVEDQLPKEGNSREPVASGALTTSVLPAIHKSPTLRLPWQDRVVVVLDIVE